MFRPNMLFIAILAVYTLAMRLMPYALSYAGVSIDPAVTIYPWNFSPMAAFCLFGAAFYSRHIMAFLVPLGIFFLGDLGIWALTGHRDWAFHDNAPLTYACFGLVIGLGLFLRNRCTMKRVWAVGLTGEVLFFLITNFGEWVLSAYGNRPPGFLVYPATAEGLLACYMAALPFFGKSLVSTLFFSTLIFRPFLQSSASLAPAISTVEKPVGSV